MNISKQIRGLQRVQDLSLEEQTPQLKKELYDMILPYVRKYQPLYYVQYQGDLRDLASDLYLQFMTRKGRGGKSKPNLLDKYDPEVTVLPYLVKVCVIRGLIDRSRADKGNLHFSETYEGEESANKLTLDILSNKLSTEEETKLENIEFSEDFIAEMKDKFNELSQADKDKFKRSLKHYRTKVGLHENFDELFSYLEKDMEEHYEGDITIEGTKPNFTIVFTHPDGTREETPARSRSVESALKKAARQYPGARLPLNDSKHFFKRLLHSALKVYDSTAIEVTIKDFEQYLLELVGNVQASEPNEAGLRFDTGFYRIDDKGDIFVACSITDKVCVLNLVNSSQLEEEIVFDPKNTGELEDAIESASLWYELHG